MIERKLGYLETRSADAPNESHELHARGFAVLPQALSADEVTELREDVLRVFSEFPSDARRTTDPDTTGKQDMFRYEMLNRSAVCQRTIGNARLLEVIEPLLGRDCHVIANTAWRNPVDERGSREGGRWHIDAGPHVPRPPGTKWPEEIPYPVFALAVHFLLQDVHLEDGPTGVIPGSHRSGQHPAFESTLDETLTCDGESRVPILADAGDIAIFVSDLWHRRMPTLAGKQGRFFLQAHYARRDIAQRLRTTDDAHQLSDEAVARAKTRRERTLIGLHTAGFYDG